MKYSKIKQAIDEKQIIVRKKKSAINAELNDLIEKKFNKYHTWYTNGYTVIAIKNGGNSGSGPEFKYTDIVEMWIRPGDWVKVFSKEAYANPECNGEFSELDSDELAVSLMGDEYHEYIRGRY